MRKKSQQSPKTTDSPAKRPAFADGAIETGRDIMQKVLAKPRQTSSAEFSETARIQGVVIGTLAEPGKDGRPMVLYPGAPNNNPLEAITTNNLGQQYQVGHEVALGFVDGDPGIPIILGLIQKPPEPEQSVSSVSPAGKSVDVKLDGNSLTLSADREIVLQCGQSSITLTRAGKVILKGAYVSTHSSGVNRIKGGSVQIN